MLNDFVYSENLIRCATDGLAKPEDFGYWGSDDTFVTWGFCGIDKTRDSNIMDTSNFETITKELMDNYPDDFRIESYSHWLVGSLTRLVCRILKEEGDIELNNITDAFIKVMEIKDELNDYPIYDENDYFNKTHEECINYILDDSDTRNAVNLESRDDWADVIYSKLIENNVEFDPDAEMYPNYNQILFAIYESELYDIEKKEEWDMWTDEQGLQRIPVRKENPNQLKLFED